MVAALPLHSSSRFPRPPPATGNRRLGVGAEATRLEPVVAAGGSMAGAPAGDRAAGWNRHACRRYGSLSALGCLRGCLDTGSGRRSRLSAACSLWARCRRGGAVEQIQLRHAASSFTRTRLFVARSGPPLRGLPGIPELQRFHRSDPVSAIAAGRLRDRHRGEHQRLPLRAAFSTRRARRHRHS